MQTDVEPPTQVLRRPVLYPQHAMLGARFGPFAGWELPLFYTSILQEHEAVRTRAGLFDVSHLAHLEVSSPDAAFQLQLLVTQDLEALEVGQACYTPMLTPKGFILDEMIVYRLEPERFRLVANAANAEKVLAWLRARLNAGTSVEDLRFRVGTLALQGPKAVEILESVCPGSPGRLPRYRLRQAEVAGRSGWIARTGYTGEDGFELFFLVQELEAVWGALLEAGKRWGLQPAGLGARDTLRLEAGLPLGGQDLDEKTTPLEAGLEGTVVWQKGPFVGRDVLERQRREGVRRRLVGFELLEPGVPRGGCPIWKGEERIGQVTSGTRIPHSVVSAYSSCPGDRAIGLGYVVPAYARPGTEFEVEIYRRRLKARCVKLPFYRRQR
jgi:aminomethyltransferase